MSTKTIKNTYLVKMPNINSTLFKTLLKRIPYNYLPVNCEKPIYNFLFDTTSMLLSWLNEDDRPYIIMSTDVKLILESKNSKKNFFDKIIPNMYNFPDPGATEMVCLYPELKDIMNDEKLSRTVVEYCDAKTKKPILYLYPSNTMQPPIGSGMRLSDALNTIDDDACCDLCKEIERREKYMKTYFKSRDL